MPVAQLPSLSRRRFGQAALALGWLSPPYAPRSANARTAPETPNIVYILADDLGWGDLRCYNSHSAIPTPNAGRLAAQGMRFTDMHSSSAVCTPSRYSILTGRYCWRTRLQHGALMGYAPSLIEPGRMTVASLLRSHGYYTAGVGKWHLGLGNEVRTDYSKRLRPGPNDQGFDYYFGIPASLDIAPYLYFENNRVLEPATATIAEKNHPRGLFWRAGACAPHFQHEEVLPTCTSRAVRLIRERAEKAPTPFFLYFALPAPHTPWVPLDRYRGRSRAGDYGDYVAAVDDSLGQIMRALEDTGAAENTLLVLTSDNGADWRPEDLARFAHRANADWRGEKGDIWEAGHRIPFLARWPGKIQPGAVSTELGCLSDLMATVASILHVSLPDDAGEDSFSLLPELLGQKHKPIRSSIVYHALDGMFALRVGSWKLVEGLGSGGFSSPRRVEPAPAGPNGQLYNLSSDPEELDNLYQARPEIVDWLAGLLDKYKGQGYTRPMGPPAEAREE